GVHAPAAVMEHIGGQPAADTLAGPKLDVPDMIRYAFSEKDLSWFNRNEGKPPAVTIPRDQLPGATVETPHGGAATIIATETPPVGIPMVTVRMADGTITAYRPDVLKVTAPVPVDQLPPGEVIGR